MQETKTILEMQRPDPQISLTAEEGAPPISEKEFKSLFNEVPQYAMGADSLYSHIVEISIYCLQLDGPPEEDKETLAFPTHSWQLHEEDRNTYSMKTEAADAEADAQTTPPLSKGKSAMHLCVPKDPSSQGRPRTASL